MPEPIDEPAAGHRGQWTTWPCGRRHKSASSPVSRGRRTHATRFRASRGETWRLIEAEEQRRREAITRRRQRRWTGREEKRVMSKPAASDSGKSNEAGDPPLPDLLTRSSRHPAPARPTSHSYPTAPLVAGPGGWNFVSPLCHISSPGRHRPVSSFFLLSSASTKVGRDETAGSADWISAPKGGSMLICPGAHYHLFKGQCEET